MQQGGPEGPTRSSRGGARSAVRSRGEAGCKLQEFMKLFLLGEQIPDKLSVNKAGKFSAVPAVGKMLARS